MTRAGALVALAASLAVLAGCAPAPELPAPITQQEAQRRMDAQQADWWESMFPGEPMPEIEPVEYIDPLEGSTLVIDCIRDAELPGVTVYDNGWSYGSSGDDAADRLVKLTLFTCSQEYPYDVSDPAALGMLSDAESAWIGAFDGARLVPCLRLLGYDIPVQAESRFGSLYDAMSPQPTTAAEWAYIDFRCPPSPIGPLWRSPVAG